MSVFMSGTCHFNYCSFEMYFKVRKFDLFGFILLSQDCFGYFVCVCVFPYKLISVFSLSIKNTVSILMEIILNLQIPLSSVYVLPILSFPVLEPGLSYHFLIYSLIFSIHFEVFSIQVFDLHI